MDDYITNTSITSKDVIGIFSIRRKDESLLYLREACTLIEKAYSDHILEVGPQFRIFIYNLAVVLVLFPLDIPTIIVTMLYPLMNIDDKVLHESIQDIFTGITEEGSEKDSIMAESLSFSLNQFSKLEWNTWLILKHNIQSISIKQAYLHAVGPAAEEEKLFFAENDKFLTRQKQVHNLVNLLSTVANDWRVVCIKLVERICLISLLVNQKLEFDQIDPINYARISLAVYVPLAERQGLWSLKTLLENASLNILDPVGYNWLNGALKSAEAARRKDLDRIIDIVKWQLHEAGFDNIVITGRKKHIYSVYRKMKNKGFSIDQINDLIGVRIIVQSNQADNVRNPKKRLNFNKVSDVEESVAINTCYKIFYELQEKWAPVGNYYDGQDMRDWIEKPKENGYQSIHTTLLIEDVTVEVQIRTQRMHERAEWGPAAHSKYKSEENYGSIQP